MKTKVPMAIRGEVSRPRDIRGCRSVPMEEIKALSDTGIGQPPPWELVESVGVKYLHLVIRAEGDPSSYIAGADVLLADEGAVDMALRDFASIVERANRTA